MTIFLEDQSVPLDFLIKCVHMCICVQRIERGAGERFGGFRALMGIIYIGWYEPFGEKFSSHSTSQELS